MSDLLRRAGGAVGMHLMVFLGVTLGAATASASEGQVEYRQHVMSAIGGHMQSVADILRQKVTHTDHLPLHVDALAELAGIADTLFPEGSEGGDALPAVWSNPDDFAGRMRDFEEAAQGLKTALETGGSIGPALQKVGQACKNCHDDFREE